MGLFEIAGEVALALKAALALHFGIFEIACLLEVAREDTILLHMYQSEMGDESALAPLFVQIRMIEEAALALQLYLIEKAALALQLS